MLERNELDQVYTVYELNQELKHLMESTLGDIYVQGEIGTFSEPASKHWYFTLKDEHAQIRCCMFRQAQIRASTRPKEGMAIKIRGKLSLYLARGETQIIVSALEESGVGALAIRFQQLKQALSEQGLFSEDRKKPLPETIERIALITSSTGAALHDVLSTLEQRWPLISVAFYPTLVQGERSVATIVDCINRANQNPRNQVIVLVRGGGSLEDLWSFNEEAVVRAISDTALPVVTGIGHETDFTLSDFVSDLRAPTPTAAAVAVSPDGQEVRATIAAYQEQLYEKTESLVEQLTISQDYLYRRLQVAHPTHSLSRNADNVSLLTHQLHRSIGRIFSHQAETVNSLVRSMKGYHPQNTLKRGYSIITDESGTVIKDPRQVSIHQNLEAAVEKGKIRITVRE